MEKKELEYYREKLLALKTEILSNGILRKKEDLEISSDDLPDEADIATAVVNQQVSFNMRAREIEKIRSIETALQRIEEGTYGHCEECDEEIGKKRLENQPWTSLCITHAEQKEREENRFKKTG